MEKRKVDFNCLVLVFKNKSDKDAFKTCALTQFIFIDIFDHWLFMKVIILNRYKIWNLILFPNFSVRGLLWVSVKGLGDHSSFISNCEGNFFCSLSILMQCLEIQQYCYVYAFENTATIIILERCQFFDRSCN